LGHYETINSTTPFFVAPFTADQLRRAGGEADPDPTPTDTDYCLPAEQNLERLQCRDRAGNPMWVNRHGERFRDTCETAQREGRIFFNPKCITNAKHCTEANRCPAEGMQ